MRSVRGCKVQKPVLCHTDGYHYPSHSDSGFQTHVQCAAIKESVVKLSLSKLFNLSPRVSRERHSAVPDKITVRRAVVE